MEETDPDAPLIERIGRGDPSAARRFVVDKLPRLTGLAYRLLRDNAAAEDVAQEALLRAWRQAPRWRPGRARFDTWLHTVVLNLCRDRLRQRRESSDDTLPERADPAPDAEAALIEQEHAAQVAAAISALPERQREAILLIHYQELSGAQAAMALNVSVEALESLLARGRRTLRRQFAEETDE